MTLDWLPLAFVLTLLVIAAIWFLTWNRRRE